jgi:cobalt-zinc-cadmium efflux system protein
MYSPPYPADMIMSVGLIISSLIIFFLGNPNGYTEEVTQWNAWHLFDPLATYLFSIVSLASTLPVVKNAYYLLMETTPTYIKISELKRKFEAVDGVIDVHDIHVWDLKPGKTLLIAHILASTDMERRVLIELSDIARKSKIFHSTFQVEEEEWKD